MQKKEPDKKKNPYSYNCEGYLDKTFVLVAEGLPWKDVKNKGYTNVTTKNANTPISSFF